MSIIFDGICPKCGGIFKLGHDCDRHRSFQVIEEVDEYLELRKEYLKVYNELERRYLNTMCQCGKIHCKWCEQDRETERILRTYSYYGKWDSG